MGSPVRRIITGIGFFLMTCVVAAIGYILAGWHVMDAIYMVIITIFGVGYGEVQPIESPGLRVFTIGVIIAGYAAAIYAVGGFMQVITEGEIKRALGARRMTQGIEKLSGHTIVCGFGRVGRILAEKLEHSHKSFVVIDVDPEKLQRAEDAGYFVVRGSATDDEVLERAGVRVAKTLACVVPDDAANVFISLTASHLNPSLEIVARAEDPATEQKLLRSGATKVVLPAAIGAVRMADLIIQPSAAEILDQAAVRSDLGEQLGQIGLRLTDLEVPVGSPLSGKTVGDIEVGGNHGFLVFALRRADGEVVLNPPDDTTITGGDSLAVLGHADDIPRLAQRYTLQRSVRYRGASINA